MNVVLLSGSHPRHLYLANVLRHAGLLSGLVMETREDFVPSPPAGLSETDHHNFVRHFHDRHVSEQQFFGDAVIEALSDIPKLSITMEELNAINTIDWIRKREPEFILSYGVHKISDDLLQHFPGKAWNIHGGLSPWYRGNITLFWPFYFLQPNWAGMTIHGLTSRLDGGPIIHHSIPLLEYGDGIHDVACKAVMQAANDIVTIMKRIGQGQVITGQTQNYSGKLFTSQDWRPEHLRIIYNLFQNDIVDRFLDGEINSADPPLIRAF